MHKRPNKTQNINYTNHKQINSQPTALGVSISDYLVLVRIGCCFGYVTVGRGARLENGSVNSHCVKLKRAAKNFLRINIYLRVTFFT